MSRENSFERSRRTKSKDDFGRTDVSSSSRDVELDICRDLIKKLTSVNLLTAFVGKLLNKNRVQLRDKNDKLCGFYQITSPRPYNFLRIFDNLFYNIFRLNIKENFFTYSKYTI